MNKNKILILLSILLLTGCVKDDSYNKANCNDIVYDIETITRWSNSNYTLRLKNGEIIEVHPMNCYFYNETLGDDK
jgi:hypothetical protein